MKKILLIALLLAPVMMRAQDSIPFLAEQSRLQAMAIDAMEEDMRAYAKAQMVGTAATAGGVACLAFSMTQESPDNARMLNRIGLFLSATGIIVSATSTRLLRRHDITVDERGVVIGIGSRKKK